MLTFRSGSGDL